VTKHWADLKDRVVTNYPGVVVTLDDAGWLRVKDGDMTITVSKIGVDDQATVTHSGLGDGVWVSKPEPVADAGYRVLDLLGSAWRAAQRPKTSPGGPSSGGGGDCDAVSGDYYEPSNDDGDGGDDE